MRFGRISQTIGMTLVEVFGSVSISEIVALGEVVLPPMCGFE
jgi:hypothetical protein